MTYTVRLTKKAEKDVAKLGSGIRDRILKSLVELRSDPLPRGAQKLEGRRKESPRYRIRVGDYRIVYRVDDDVLIVLVLKVGHRREIYRDL